MTAVVSTVAYPGYVRIRLNGRNSNTKSRGMYVAKPTDFSASFPAVLNRWRNETQFMSDPSRKIEHPSYVAMVKNAGLVLDLIKNELRREPSNLVWVLEDHFGIEPYEEDDAGDVIKQTERWLVFLGENG